jgi:alkylated DNA repair protein (DNA oxidative demethylase)
MRDPFHDQSTLVLPVREVLAEGAVLMRGFALPHAKEVMAALEIVTRQAPFRHMITLGGFTMSVAMTNCGSAGWVTDRTGYRYDPIDPETGEKWPTLPSSFLELAGKAAHEAGYPDFVPDATPDIDLASVPSDTKAAVGYQELYALWKADLAAAASA